MERGLNGREDCGLKVEVVVWERRPKGLTAPGELEIRKAGD